MSEKKTKILLTGYRATGKTSVGKEVARRLDFLFLDTDQEIEKKRGKTIKQMVSERGWPYFREQEKKILEEIAPKSKVVIAAGGGAIMHRDSWQALRKNCLTVWLTASPATISSRLEKDENSEEQRPSLTDNDIVKEVEDVLEQRRAYYEQGSDLQISSEQDVEKVAERIIEAWLSADKAEKSLDMKKL